MRQLLAHALVFSRRRIKQSLVSASLFALYLLNLITFEL